MEFLLYWILCDFYWVGRPWCFLLNIWPTHFSIISFPAEINRLSYCVWTDRTWNSSISNGFFVLHSDVFVALNVPCRTWAVNIVSTITTCYHDFYFKCRTLQPHFPFSIFFLKKNRNGFFFFPWNVIECRRGTKTSRRVAWPGTCRCDDQRRSFLLKKTRPVERRARARHLSLFSHGPLFRNSLMVGHLGAI